MFYDTILNLCAMQGKKITNVVDELGISAGSPSKWKAGGEPKADTLRKLSDYFHVSVDYLLNRQTPSISSLAPEEQDLIARFRSATPKEKEDVFYILREYKAVTPTMSGESAG
ncbi:helix-turn-helix domain-containing protein [Oscillibacter ruminantium]|uniref:helix-turn-helix domain-containing protein n=1 Tax=Oscillibacter ruminantium TaxID=1263547 RepID=UPI0033258154